MTVLVIDDQIHVVEGILSEVSWENLGVDKVWKAYNAVEAKGILLLNKVDIMLCDIEMPGENGLSLLKWTQDQGMEVECIFLTAHADFVYARTAMQLGSFDYILQPARYEDIGNAILRAKQRIQEKREQQKFYSYGKTLFEERDRITDQLFREWYQEPENGERYRKLLEDMQKMGRHICDSSPCFLILCQILRWNNAPVSYTHLDVYKRQQLIRLFKEEIGMTPNEYIILSRIMRSREYLARGYSVIKVCEMVGYADESHFIRTFKKIMGITPKQYGKLRRR